MPRLPLLLALAASAILASACSLALSGPAATPQPENAAAADAPPADLLTVAERSNWKATSRYDDIVHLLDNLAAANPKIATRAEMGQTHEGRSIPLLILADPPVKDADDARAAARNGKLVVLMLGNIHAGEVCGKEALPILAREIVTADKHPLLKDLVLVFAPIYNADGNERISKDNRPGQVGPEEGMGTRENAQGLDLNRDFIKLEAPETRALVRFLNQWDPAIVIDTHTTNGSYHRYALTFEGPKTPAGPTTILEYTRDTLLPAVSKAVEEEHGIRTFFYGDLTGRQDPADGAEAPIDYTRWETFPPLPRFGTNYVGLRSRISILAEAYAYASYQDRITATLHFVRASLQHAAANKKHIKQLLDDADKAITSAGRDPAADDLIPLRNKPAPAPDKVTIAGFVEHLRGGKPVPTDEPRDYTVDHMNRTEPTLAAARPYAYLLPPTFTEAATLLQRHGIKVEQLREDIELDTEALRIDAVTRATRLFQGHHPVTVDVTPEPAVFSAPAGTLIVRTGQKLGTLAAFLLEPQSEDGLTTWNFFDDHLQIGDLHPVRRIPKPVPITTATLPPLPEDRKPPRPITFEEFYESDNRPNLTGSPISGLTWLPPPPEDQAGGHPDADTLRDSEHYLQIKDGKPWKVHALTGRAEPLYDADALAAALAALPTIDRKAADSLASRAHHSLNPARTAAFFTHENDLYYATLDGSTARRLTSTPQPEELPSFSPDGAFVAFVRDHNLYVVDVATATERALTTDGSDTIRNGKADWVYFEEVFNRNWRTYWWSPDSTRIAFFRTDSSRVPIHTLTNDTGPTQQVETARYPRPGEPNPSVRLGIVTVAGGSPTFMDASDYDHDNHLITAVGWWPDSSALWCCIQNRTQTWLDFCSLPPGGGKPKRLFRDTTEAWIDAPADPLFLKSDGSFLITSERTGFKHLYHYDKSGKLLGPITRGDWEVRTAHLIDEANRLVYFTATKDDPTALHLYRTTLPSDAGDERPPQSPSSSSSTANPRGPQDTPTPEPQITRLTPDPGSHRITLSPRGAMFIDSWSSRTSPTRVALRSTSDPAAPLRTLDTNPVHTLDDYILHPTERFQVPTRDGFLMEAAWTLPTHFDPSRERHYPVWIMTYAGPGAPTISDTWGAGLGTGPWDQALATAGVIVLRIDPRSASGKGARYAWTAYKRLGVQELQDLEDAITWLKTHNWVDPDRIGLSGHSYGGYMTAFALTHSTSFAAGIAGAPVTDWRDYDSIYTERYMSTPQDNPDGYDASSALKAAKNLHGRLLIAHGALDDNVHPTNTLKFIRALQDANKQFDLAIYPTNRHGIGGRQYQRLMHDFILRTMTRPTSPSSP